MIDLTYDVACDAIVDDGEDICEAQFTVFLDNRLSAVTHLRRQLDLRGWRIVPDSRPLRVLCPLHPEEG